MSSSKLTNNEWRKDIQYDKLRQSTLLNISLIIKRRKKNPTKEGLSRRVEGKLWSSAKTLKEYADTKTLKVRVQRLLDKPADKRRKVSSKNATTATKYHKLNCEALDKMKEVFLMVHRLNLRWNITYNAEHFEMMMEDTKYWEENIEIIKKTFATFSAAWLKMSDDMNRSGW